MSPPLVCLEDLHCLPDAAPQPVQLCLPPADPSAQVSLHLPRVRRHLQVRALPDPRHQELPALHTQSGFPVSMSFISGRVKPVQGSEWSVLSIFIFLQVIP